MAKMAVGTVLRGSVWNFRCRVPKVVALRLGRTHLTSSLRTSCPNRARLRAARIASALDNLWEYLSVTSLPPDRMRALIDDLIKRELDADALSRIETGWAADHARKWLVGQGEAAATMLARAFSY